MFGKILNERLKSLNAKLTKLEGHLINSIGNRIADKREAERRDEMLKIKIDSLQAQVDTITSINQIQHDLLFKCADTLRKMGHPEFETIEVSSDDTKE